MFVLTDKHGAFLFLIQKNSTFLNAAVIQQNKNLLEQYTKLPVYSNP